MGTMLVNGRCDYAILSNYNASAVFTSPEFCATTIYQSPQPTSIVNLTINMRPELQHIKKQIDKKLDYFISSGGASKSLLTHLPTLVFPKQASCN
jgi:ABC-type amino acid transport substrate-binding protein